jgi:hypothetical protein
MNLHVKKKRIERFKQKRIYAIKIPKLGLLTGMIFITQMIKMAPARV